MDQISDNIAIKARQIFRDDLEMVVVFGSRARGENEENSDIDLMILCKYFVDREKVNKFKRWFVDLQTKRKFLVDKDFPGEYISRSMFEKSLLGYGFVIENNKIQVENIDAGDWNAFSEYRQWLACLACPSEMLIGDRNTFNNYKKRALSSVVLIAVNNLGLKDFSIETVIESLVSKGKKYMGYVDSLYTRNYLKSELPEVFDKMLKDRHLICIDGKYHLIDGTLSKVLPLLSTSGDICFRDLFVGKESNKNTLTYLRESFDLGLEHITKTERALSYKTEDEIKEKFTERIPIKGKEMNIVLSEFQTHVLEGSINQFHPNYIAFPDAGNALSGLSADILIPFLNQNLISTTKSAPTGTFAEIQVINWMRELIGFPTGEFPSEASEVAGMVVSGGVLANTIGLLAARCKTFPTSRSKGMGNVKVKPILIIAGPTVYHYSHIAAFWWLGMGEENIIYAKTTKNYRFNPTDLEEKIHQYNDGKISKVVAIVCQAGDSRTTTIEDFETISKIVKKHNIWLHIDACHGGVMLFSSKLRSKLQGIEKADSISIDPHKGLCLTYPSSMVLFRNIKDVKLLSKSTDITIKKGSYDLGQITPFIGSKSFDSLKLWFLIKNLGIEGVGKLVEHRYDLAEAWRQSIEDSKYFISLNSIELNSVVFSISPNKVSRQNPDFSVIKENISGLNKNVHDKVYVDGYMCIHTFDIIDYPDILGFNSYKPMRVLGAIFGNPLTNKYDFPFLVEYLDNYVEELIKSEYVH